MNLELDNTHAKVTLGTVEEKEWLSDYLSFDTMDWRTKSMKRTRLYSVAAERFPSGFLQPVLKRAAADGIQIEVLDVRPPAVARDPNADLDWLRDYQKDAVEAALKAERGILWLPTGAGKGELIVGISKSINTARWCFLVHRKSLVTQQAERFETRLGEKAGIIGEGVWNPRRFTAATLQTLMRKLATPEGRAFVDSVDGLLVDECFPAGTLVDGRPIEDIRIGDTVTSYDTESKQVVQRQVTRLYANPAKELVRLHFSNGETLVCTPEHPFLTESMHWLTAKSLCGTHVLRLRGGHHAKERDVPSNVALRSMRDTGLTNDIGCQRTCEGILRTLSEGTLGAATETSCEAVQGVRCRCDVARAIGTGASTREQRVLLAGTQGNMACAAAVGGEFCHCKQVCRTIVSKDESSQSYEARRDSRQDECDLEAHRTQAEVSGRQRSSACGAASDVAGCSCEHGFGVGCGVCSSDWQGGEGTGVAARFEGGHSISCSEGCHRSGRGFTQRLERSTEGREENGVFELLRVDRVEVLQQTSDGEFGGVCRGGVVYNFEVEGTHTYTVNGIVVHNCHSTPAEEFYRVIQSFKNARYRIGLSGTPLARGDKKSVYTVGALGPVVYRIRPELLMERGVLSRPKIHLIHVDHSRSNFAWDARWQDIYKVGVTENDERNVLIVEAVKQTPKPALVFVQHVDHGHRIMRLIHKAGMNAEFVYGNASLEQRQASIKRLVRGDIDVLICSVIFQEGVDIPALQSVVIATGGASSIAAIQRVGRGMRMAEGKDSFTVWDVADRGHRWFEKHTKQRIRAYKREGYEVIGEQMEAGE